MNSTFFLGQRYKRPTKRSSREWSEPRRSAKRKPYGGATYSRKTADGFLLEMVSEPDDEGSSFSAIEIDFDRGTACHVSGGRDCDGFVHNTTDYDWDGQQWVVAGRRVYDQFAQAAGY